MGELFDNILMSIWTEIDKLFDSHSKSIRTFIVKELAVAVYPYSRPIMAQ